MATIFFARSGNDPSRASAVGDVAMQSIMEKLDRKGTMYSSKPLVINEHETPSPYSDYIHVVIKVEEYETNNKFTKSGFYLIQDLSPTECKAILDLL